MKVHIIGSGFSGLTSAFYLYKSGFEVEVFELEKNSGGLIQTIKTPWGLSETAANGILNSVLLEDLCKDIGLTLGQPKKTSRRRFIFCQRPRQWPLGFRDTLVVLWRFIFKRNKLPKPYESVALWVTRLFGKAALKWLVSPALHGIYAGDTEKMSATLIFTTLNSRERVKTQKYRGIVSPQNGMGEVILKLQTYLQAQGVKFYFETKYELSKSLDHPIVISTSVDGASGILRAHYPEYAQKLSDIEVLPVISVTLFYKKGAEALNGFGCLFPRETGFRVLGVLCNDKIFENRSSGHSETWIYGGALDKTVIEKSDEEIIKLIKSERERLYHKVDEPLGFSINRWNKALPHYTLELEKTLNENWQDNLANNNIWLMGNYLGSLGLSQILVSTSQLPEKIKIASKKIQENLV
ncbi:MAG: FAD-dependent oxidoreductase [Oligoflexia bacterium]|nr:FAD-dependent oxidoreductase [Oligoflexia bacterium]